MSREITGRKQIQMQLQNCFDPIMHCYALLLYGSVLAFAVYTQGSLECSFLDPAHKLKKVGTLFKIQFLNDLGVFLNVLQFFCLL